MGQPHYDPLVRRDQSETPHMTIPDDEALLSDSEPLDAEIIPRPRRTTKGQRRFGANRPVAAAVENKVAVMTAAGIGAIPMAKALGMGHNTVYQIQARPQIQALIEEMRLRLRDLVMQKQEQITSQAYEWLGSVVDAKKDAKSFDALTRGLGNMERTAASVSGEARKVEATITHEENAPAEAKALVLALLKR